MEHIKTPKVENVRLIENHSRNSDVGTLYLTATHLIFVDSKRSKEKWIVHSHIQQVEKLNLVQSGSPLRIRCKNFQVLNFIIAQERDCHDLHLSLCKLSRPTSLRELYAFTYVPRDQQLLTNHEVGWDMYQLTKDFMQMGLPTLHWKISRINNEFEVCKTYPPIICVPSMATAALLLGSADFRSKHRLPVLSYRHSNGAAVVRCAQPMSGFNSRSIEDEAYVDLIRRSKPRPNDFMYIVDTRPMINAMANRAQGKGYENTDFYENIKFHFLGIDNIHVMRASLHKMLDACCDVESNGNWLDALISSGWQRHVHSVLQVSRFIAHAVGIEGRSVLVHCSDGWDRTAQVCSLAAIMLESRYRTIDGLFALIQREWLDLGHKFSDRCGHLDRDSREVSPIFTQFIDAVWQLLRLKPTSFQFNEKLLMELHDHVYSCQFGTFLCNSARERIDENLNTSTYSLWAYMTEKIPMFTNPFFSIESSKDQLLLPPTQPHFVKFWLAMYSRYSLGLQPRENLENAMTKLNEHAVKLEAEKTSLRKAKSLIRSAFGLIKRRSDQNITTGSTLCGALTSVNQTILNNNDVTTTNHVIDEECSTSSITTRDACVMYKRASDDVDDTSSISTSHDVTSEKISPSLTDLKLTSSDEVA